LLDSLLQERVCVNSREEKSKRTRGRSGSARRSSWRTRRKPSRLCFLYWGPALLCWWSSSTPPPGQSQCCKNRGITDHRSLITWSITDHMIYHRSHDLSPITWSGDRSHDRSPDRSPITHHMIDHRSGDRSPITRSITRNFMNCGKVVKSQSPVFVSYGCELFFKKLF